MTPTDQQIQDAYEIAKQRYAEYGVDTDEAMTKLAGQSISLHCWQGDDVGGFEDTNSGLTGGIAVTGNYPGKARNPDELRSDLDRAYSLIPGRHRVNLHAIYGDSEIKMDRNDWRGEHFDRWIDWARSNKHGIDFNPTCFSHPMANGGFTLASLDKTVREFWIEHCSLSREIGGYIGQKLNDPVVTNLWIPDGYKDTPVDRSAHRALLVESLDKVFSTKIGHPDFNRDAVESKLFGIGSESYVVGSHEFYMGYAVKNQTLLTLDAGHFHPTEVISDKISSVLLYVPEILLHVSRGVRWDSDHVVTLTDELQSIMQEIVRGDFLGRTHIGLDYFDASINRVAAWVVGTRAALKAMLLAMLEPIDQLRAFEQNGDLSSRLAMLEELKSMPFGAIWDQYCVQQGVPVGYSFMDQVRKYERAVLAER